MPRNTHPLYGLVMIPTLNGNVARRRRPRKQGGNPQAEMLAEWLREMHFSDRNGSFRYERKGRVRVRITFLKPIAARS